MRSDVRSSIPKITVGKSGSVSGLYRARAKFYLFNFKRANYSTVNIVRNYMDGNRKAKTIYDRSLMNYCGPIRLDAKVRHPYSVKITRRPLDDDSCMSC